MYITKLILKNFQSYKYYALDFKSGANAILGENNGGKSTILRAIYWVLKNSPAGDWPKRLKSSKNAEVSARLVFDDGTTIARAKVGTENIYLFNDERFTGFGRNVPAQIEEFIGKLELDLGNVELEPWMAFADSSSFLHHDSAPVRGSVLNYLTGIDVADKIKKKIIKEHNATKSSIKDFEELEIEGKRLLKKYRVLKKTKKKIKSANRSFAAYEKICEKINVCEEAKEKLSKLAKEKKALDKFIDRAGKVLATGKRYLLVEQVLSLLQAHNKQAAALCGVAGLKGRMAAVNGVSDRLIAVSKTLQMVQDFSMEDARLKNSIKDAKKELSKYDKCPECGSIVVREE